MFESLRYSLKYNRKHVMRRISGIFIFGLIVLVMGFWGINKSGQTQGMSQGTAAIVNGQAIPMARLQEAMERLRRDPRMAQYEALGGEFGQKMLERQALSQVVQGELIRQRDEKEHITTSDQEVADAIMKIQPFQENGQFNRQYYNNYLSQSGKTSAEFESEIRNDLSTQRTVAVFKSALAPTATELEMEKGLKDKKAAVEFVKVPNDTLIQPESVKQAQLKEFFAKPENEKKVKDYYETHKKDYAQQEQVKARHILIKSVEGDKDAENKAFAKAQDIEKQLKAGGDFAALAKKYSEDPGSKDKGGELGFFSKETMVAPFSQWAFGAKPDEISPPVKTQFGYHIIQVEAKKPAATQTYDEVKDTIAQTIIARDQSHELVANLEKALKSPEANAAVSKLVADNKLKWEDAGTFDLNAEGVPKVGDSDDAVRTAFSLTKEKPLADHLIRSGPNAYVLRYKTPSEEAKKKNAEPNPEDNQDLVAAFQTNRRAEEALRGWVENFQKNSKIATTDAAPGAGGGGSPFDDE